MFPIRFLSSSFCVGASRFKLQNGKNGAGVTARRSHRRTSFSLHNEQNLLYTSLMPLPDRRRTTPTISARSAARNRARLAEVRTKGSTGDHIRPCSRQGDQSL